MTMLTKYNIGDEVWWFWAGSCVPARGIIVAFWKREDGEALAQIISREMSVNIPCRRLYSTKEELLKSL